MDQIADYESFGYKLTKDSTKGYTYDLVTSLEFEMAAFVIFVISFIYFLVMHFKIAALKSPQNKKLAMFLHHWMFS